MSRLRPHHLVAANLFVLAVATLGVAQHGRTGAAGHATPPSSSASPTTTDDGRQEQDVVYVRRAGAPLMLDWYAPPPTGQGRLALVFVPGGGWEGGDRGQFRRAAQVAVEHGYVGITIDYRPAPAATFPAQPEDVAAALAWVHEHAAQLGVDPHRVVLAGSSAGANLATLVASWDRDAPHPPVAGVVAWSGLYDLRELASAAADAGQTHWRAMFEAYLGCTVDDPACDSRHEDASPATHVDLTDPPMLLVHGAREFVPVEDAEAYQRQRDAEGLRTQLRVYDTDAHGSALVTRSLDDVTSFLDGLRPAEGA